MSRAFQSACTLLVILLLAPPSAFPQHPMEIVPVAEGVYFVWKQERLPGIFTSNSVVIINEKDVVVVDADGWADAARDLIERIRKITEKPVRTLVLTHGAPDHVQALYVWKQEFPEIEIVSHQTTAGSIKEITIPFLQTQKDRLSQQISELVESPQVRRENPEAGRRLEFLRSYRRGLDELEWIFPTTTFDRSLTLHRDGREIRLLFFGGGHSPGDVVVYLPQEKTLIAGDLIMSDRVFPGFYFPVAYRGSLKEMEALDFDILLPGHGPMLQGKSFLRLVRELADFLVSEVGSGLSAGKSLEEIQDSLELADFKTRFVAIDPDLGNHFDRRMPRAIANIYQEMTSANPR